MRTSAVETSIQAWSPVSILYFVPSAPAPMRTCDVSTGAAAAAAADGAVVGAASEVACAIACTDTASNAAKANIGIIFKPTRQIGAQRGRSMGNLQLPRDTKDRKFGFNQARREHTPPNAPTNALQRFLVSIARANADHFPHRGDEDLPIADFAGAGGGDDRINRPVH